MTTQRKPLEELIRELPPERREEVRQFVEIMLARPVPNASVSAEASERMEHTKPLLEDLERRTVRQYFGAWDSGDENSADNDRIDADLALEYGAAHEAER